MTKTSIEWTGFSANPIRARLNGRTGHYCEKISGGCKHCYSSRMQRRFGMPEFQEQRRMDVEHFLDTKPLLEILGRKQPAMHFWCSMTDMFGEWVPFEWIAACFGVMAATPHHTHQVLTKRPDRAAKFFRWVTEGAQDLPGLVGEECPPETSLEASSCIMIAMRILALEDRRERPFVTALQKTPWPMSNVWLGVSAENQEQADKRIPLLLECPAAVRWISAEPLLGEIRLGRWLGDNGRRNRFSGSSGTGLVFCGRPRQDLAARKVHGRQREHRFRDYERTGSGGEELLRGERLCPSNVPNRAGAQEGFCASHSVDGIEPTDDSGGIRDQPSRRSEVAQRASQSGAFYQATEHVSRDPCTWQDPSESKGSPVASASGVDSTDLRSEVDDHEGHSEAFRGALAHDPKHCDAQQLARIAWVVAGSESGHGARPMDLEWIASLRDQCAAAGVPFFTKQISNEHDKKGGNPEHWPPGPWPREFPEVPCS